MPTATPVKQKRPAAPNDVCPICGKPMSECKSSTEVFDVKNLDCADCASRMEARIERMPRVEDASITYATKQLRVTCPHPDQMRLRFQEECRKVDDDVLVVEHQRAPKAEQARAKAAADKAEEAVEESQEPEEEEEALDVRQIVAAGVLFVAGEVAEHAFEASAPAWLAPALYLVAYVVAGLPIVAQAARNLAHGRVFDENFLMTVATFGAIGVQQFPEAVGVMLFYRIGEAAEDRAVDRSRGQVMEALDMRPETVELLDGYKVVEAREVDGAVEVDDARARTARTVPADDAKVGDFLLVKPGARIPLDGTVVEGASRLDTSAVTGEPVPVGVAAGDAVTSGCVNGEGMLVMRVDKPLSESMVSRILDTVENAAASKPKMERFITRFARVYTPIVIAIAAATAVVPSLATGDWARWVYTACTFLVISCPCAIVLSVPLSFFSGIGAAGKLGVLFKGGTALEALSRVRAVVMDKTGTVTKGVFQVNDVRLAGAGAGRGASEGEGTAVESTAIDADALVSLAASAEAASTHPIARSVVAEAERRGCSPVPPKRVEELAGKGVVASGVVGPDGASHTVACGNAALMEHVGAKAPKGADAAESGSVVLVAVDGSFAGSVLISDVPKDDAKKAVSWLHRLGVRTAMLTGDAEPAARAVADEVGIDEVHARLLPQDKLSAMEKVRASQGAVAFVGDGVNDAPVLAGADVGMAMGSGSDAAIEAADVVVMGSDMESVPRSIQLARAVQFNARENVVFALAVKVTVMVLGFVGLASMWAAVFADSGVALLCVLNSVRLLRKRF